MSNTLTGSDLTCAMLARGDKEIWCAVADTSDKEAMEAQDTNDFTARIVSYNNDHFFCTSGTKWLFAVPIKMVEMTYTELDLKKIK